MKLEAASELYLHEALFSKSKSYLNNIKPKESKTKHKGVQYHKNTLRKIVKTV